MNFVTVPIQPAAVYVIVWIIIAWSGTVGGMDDPYSFHQRGLLLVSLLHTEKLNSSEVTLCRMVTLKSATNVNLLAWII